MGWGNANTRTQVIEKFDDLGAMAHLSTSMPTAILTFKLEKHIHEDVEDENLRLGADKVLLSCVGVGITNMYKKTS